MHHNVVRPRLSLTCAHTCASGKHVFAILTTADYRYWTVRRKSLIPQRHFEIKTKIRHVVTHSHLPPNEFWLHCQYSLDFGVNFRTVPARPPCFRCWKRRSMSDDLSPYVRLAATVSLCLHVLGLNKDNNGTARQVRAFNKKCKCIYEMY